MVAIVMEKEEWVVTLACLGSGDAAWAGPQGQGFAWRKQDWALLVRSARQGKMGRKMAVEVLLQLSGFSLWLL